MRVEIRDVIRRAAKRVDKKDKEEKEKKKMEPGQLLLARLETIMWPERALEIKRRQAQLDIEERARGE